MDARPWRANLCHVPRRRATSSRAAEAGQASCGARGWEGRCSMARPLPQMLRRPGSTRSTDVMPYTTFLAISATIVALVLSACGGSSRSSTSSAVTATSATAANPVQRENSRLGSPGWEIPASAGMVIAPGEGRPLVRRQPPVGVSTTAPAPRHPLCRGRNRPVGGITAADRHRAAGKRSTNSLRPLGVRAGALVHSGVRAIGLRRGTGTTARAARGPRRRCRSRRARTARDRSR